MRDDIDGPRLAHSKLTVWPWNDPIRVKYLQHFFDDLEQECQVE